MEKGENETSFTQYLFSNASKDTYPNNNPSHFKVKLAGPISLKGEWEVGVSQIIFANELKNLNTQTTFVVSFEYHPNKNLLIRPEKKTCVQQCTFPAGQFRNVEQLIETLNVQITQGLSEIISAEESENYWLMKDNGADKVHDTKICLDIGNHEYYITSKLKNFKIIFEEGQMQLWSVFGFKASKDHLSTQERFPAETYLNMQLPALFVYTPIIEYLNVGDSLGPLLALIPVKGSTGQYDWERIDRPVYNRLSHNYINEIEILIVDHLGKEVEFGISVLALVLHFRRVK